MAALLVAGGTGLVGTPLVELALAQGHTVTLLCRAMPRILNVNRAMDVVQVDLMAPDQLWQRLPRKRFDAVIYLAQGDDHNSFPANARLAVALNIAAPLALCQWTIEQQCGKFVYASSGGIGGAQTGEHSRISEATPALPSDRLSFYLATKARCEELLSAFADQVAVTTLRYFFVYGRGQRADFLLPRMAAKIRTAEPILLASGTGPRFNPIHALDAAALTLRASCTPCSRIINIAGSEDTDLGQVVLQISNCIGIPANTLRTPETAPNFLADTELAGKHLGRCEIALAEGLRRSFSATGRQA